MSGDRAISKGKSKTRRPPAKPSRKNKPNTQRKKARVTGAFANRKK